MGQPGFSRGSERTVRQGCVDWSEGKARSRRPEPCQVSVDHRSCAARASRPWRSLAGRASRTQRKVRARVLNNRGKRTSSKRSRKKKCGEKLTREAV